MTRPCKLNCAVSPGMFQGEYLAKIDSIAADGSRKDVHVYVDKVCLESIRSGHALLKATTVSSDRKGVGVLLPQSTFENGPYVLVPKEVIAG